MLLAGVLLTSAGCARMTRMARPERAPPAAAPVPVSPFADTAVSFFVKGAGFVRGELVIVRVCVGTNRSIASSDIVESSGDSRFDALAVVWARRVRLRALPPDGAQVAPCGAVRVEMRRASDPHVNAAPDGLLG